LIAAVSAALQRRESDRLAALRKEIKSVLDSLR
jgi:hypothetical protein